MTTNWAMAMIAVTAVLAILTLFLHQRIVSQELRLDNIYLGPRLGVEDCSQARTPGFVIMKLQSYSAGFTDLDANGWDDTVQTTPWPVPDTDGDGYDDDADDEFEDDEFEDEDGEEVADLPHSGASASGDNGGALAEAEEPADEGSWNR